MLGHIHSIATFSIGFGGFSLELWLFPMEIEFMDETEAAKKDRAMLDNLPEVQFVTETKATKKDSAMLDSLLEVQFVAET